MKVFESPHMSVESQVDLEKDFPKLKQPKTKEEREL